MLVDTTLSIIWKKSFLYIAAPFSSCLYFINFKVFVNTFAELLQALRLYSLKEVLFLTISRYHFIDFVLNNDCCFGIRRMFYGLFNCLEYI